jgi:PilZ domain-containing protein
MRTRLSGDRSDEGDGVRRKIGDRRVRPRFDIVGDLWGTLETVLQLPLRNVSRGGALIHSHVPLPSQSVHRLAFNADGHDVSVPVRVSHVDAQTSADGERTYLIGVQFLSAQPALLELIDAWTITGRAEGAGA